MQTVQSRIRFFQRESRTSSSSRDLYPKMEVIQNYICVNCERYLPRSEFHEASSTDRERPVTSHCRECRSQRYFKRRYPIPCSTCAQHRKLDGNSLCRECNEASGLRECRECTNVLLAELHFYRKRKTCNECANRLRFGRRRLGKLGRVK